MFLLQQVKEKAEKKAYSDEKMNNRIELKRANMQLLGKLHTDHQYLKSLLENPLLTKKYTGSENLTAVPKKVS